jgi:hypothetical protein
LRKLRHASNGSNGFAALFDSLMMSSLKQFIALRPSEAAARRRLINAAKRPPGARISRNPAMAQDNSIQ